MTHRHSDSTIHFIPPDGAQPCLIRRTCTCGAIRDHALEADGTGSDSGWYFSLPLRVAIELLIEHEGENG